MADIPIEIDQSFFLPPQVIDLRYIDEDEKDYSDVSTDSSISVEDLPNTFEEEVLTPEGSSVLPIPEQIDIVSQQVRSIPGGGYVVDIVVNIEDMEGVDGFDLSVTKV